MSALEYEYRRRALQYVNDTLTGRNLDSVDELFAYPADCEFDPNTSAEITDYEDLKAYFASITSSLSDSEMTVRNTVVDGDEVVVLWELETTVVESFQGVPATGQRVSVDGMSYLRFEDGQIVASEESVDRASFMPPVAWGTRQQLVENMDDGVVVLDEADRIIDVNRNALRPFDAAQDAVLGEPATALFGADVDLPEPGETRELSPGNGRRIFEIQASVATDELGDRDGCLLVLRDVTARERRNQQREVLNRVLRHNLRNELLVILARAETVREHDVPSEVESAADTVVRVARRLQSLGETARQIEAALDLDSGPTAQSLAAVVDSAVTRVRTEHPDATITVDVPADLTVGAIPSFEFGVEAIVENACEHNDDDPSVRVTATRREDDTVALLVADDGPGIPASEVRALETGEETPLEHATGLGLWLAHWSVSLSGGDLSFSTLDPSGTVVTVELPAGP